LGKPRSHEEQLNDNVKREKKRDKSEATKRKRIADSFRSKRGKNGSDARTRKPEKNAKHGGAGSFTGYEIRRFCLGSESELSPGRTLKRRRG